MTSLRLSSLNLLLSYNLVKFGSTLVLYDEDGCEYATEIGVSTRSSWLSLCILDLTLKRKTILIQNFLLAHPVCKQGLYRLKGFKEY